MAKRGAKLGRSVLDLDIDDSKFHSKMSGAYKAAQGFTDQTGKTLMKAGKAMTGVGQSMTRNVTLPIVAAGGAVSKLAFDFDETMGQIVALTSVGQDQMAGFRDEILAMAPAVGKGPQELAEAFYFIASAGFEGAEAMEILESTAQAAAAGLGDTATVSKVIGAAVNAYGVEASEAAVFTDQLVAAIGEGSAEAPEFAGALGNVIGSAAQIGASFSDVTGAIAAMTNVGIGADEAVTSLNQVFVSLFKPTTEAADALAEMGLSAAGLRQMIADEGLMPTLGLLAEKFDGNAEATASVFGNVRALRGVLALTGPQMEDTAALIGRVGDSAGATGDAFASVAETDSFKLKQAFVDLETTGVQLGADVLPLIVEVVGELADIARGLSKAWAGLDDDTQQLIIRAVALVAVAGPLLIVLGKLTTGAGLLFKAVGFLAGPKGLLSLVKFAPTVASAMHMMLGPIGIVTGAISLLAAGFATDFLGMRTRLERDVDDMAMNFGDMGDAVHDLADDTGMSFQEAKDAVRDYMEETGASFDTAVRRVRTGSLGITDAQEAMLEKSGAQWESYQEQISGAAEAGAAAAQSLPPEIAAAMDATELEAEQLNLDAIAEEAEKARAAALDRMQAMISGIATLFETDESVRDEWQALIDRMDDPYTEAERRADIFSQATIANIRSAIQSGDPKIADDSRILVENMLGQIEAMEPGALTSGEAVPPAIRDGMDESMSQMIDWIEQTLVPGGLAALTMEDADEIGVGNIWRYAEGMRRNQQAAIDAAANIAKLAEFQLHIDAGGGGWSIIESWIGGMENAYINNQGRIWGVVDGVKRSLGGSLPTEGPLKGGAASGGQSIAESWIGALVEYLDPVPVQQALRGIAGAMTLGSFDLPTPTIPGMSGVSSLSDLTSTAAEGLGITVEHREYHMHYNGRERIFDSGPAFMAELESIARYDDGGT